jgi:FMN phosphatase YigB (HAD superfamily)
MSVNTDPQKNVWKILCVFYDIGGTLGTPRIVGGHLAGITLLPEVLTRLEAARKTGVRLGVISNTGNESAKTIDDALAAVGLLSFFPEPLRIYSSVVGITKSNPAIFLHAAKAAGLSSGNCLYVGEDAAERQVATQAGFRVAADPASVLGLLSA